MIRGTVEIFGEAERAAALERGAKLQAHGHAVNVAESYSPGGKFESVTLTHYLTCAACAKERN